MTNKHPLLSEYKQYLQTISVTQGTKNVYAVKDKLFWENINWDIEQTDNY